MPQSADKALARGPRFREEEENSAITFMSDKPAIPRSPSAETVRLNPHLFGGAPSPASATVPPATRKKPRSMAPPKLNKTEQRWQGAHPSHIPFPLRLRWGKCMNYTPDFMDTNQPLMTFGKPTLIEVKGGHIRDRDLVRFKGCAAEWGWLFRFELWQWKDRNWTQLL